MDDNLFNKCEGSNQKRAKRDKGIGKDDKESMDIMQEIEKLKMKLENDFNKYSAMKNNKQQERIKQSKGNDNNGIEVVNIKKGRQVENNDQGKDIQMKSNDNDRSTIDNDIIDKTPLTINRFNTIGDIPALSLNTPEIDKPIINPIEQEVQSSVIGDGNQSSIMNNKAGEDNYSIELKELESQLTIDERLSHDNRQIRKNACKEISSMCLEPFTEETKQDFFDCFSPWVKYCIEETNSYVLPEALNFFIVFNSTFPEFKSSSQKDFFANLERIASFGISNLNELCMKIIINYLQDKRLFNQAFTEMLKALDKASIRLIKFIYEIIAEIIMKDIFLENHLKVLFEKVINVYEGITIKNSEKKKMYGKIIVLIYEVIEDDLKTILHYIHLHSVKDFDALLNKVKKTSNDKELKYCLYPKIDYDNGNEDNHQQKSKLNFNRILQADINHQLNDKGKENTTGEGEVIDLSSILPNKFFEYNFSTSFPDKMRILEESNAILSKVINVKDKEKNYTEIYKTINYSIDEQNILIHLEGIKAFGQIARLLQSKINLGKLKTLLESCFDKFKDKKSIVKNELFSLFDIIISNECITIDSFILFVLQLCLGSNKKIATIVKQGILEYLKMLMKNNTSPIIELLGKIGEKAYVNYAKILIEIIVLESQGSIKDLCTDLLIIDKGRIGLMEGKEQFSVLMQKLPNYRKTLVLNLNDNNKKDSGREYKKSLGRIKSNMSFSSCKSVGKDSSKLVSSNRKEIASTPKIDKIKSKMLFKEKKEGEMKESKRPATANMKVIKKETADKDNDKIKPMTKTKAEKEDMKKCIKDKEKEDNKEKEKTTNTEIVTNGNSTHEQRKREYLEKRKDDVANHINSLNSQSLEEYSKIIVRDFLGFINKVYFGQLNESLSCHFTVIFDILTKIIQRMIILNESNNTPKLIEDLSNRIIRVIIIYPCINQLDPNSSFIKESLLDILKALRHLNNNDEAYLLYLIVNVIKFTNKRKTFLEKVNPHPIIVFFLSHMQSFNIESNDTTEIMTEFIIETIHLSTDEKEMILNKRPVNKPRTETASITNETKTDEEKINYELLAKKIKESEEMIRLKEEENERLKQQLMQYEDEKKNESESILQQVTFLTETHQTMMEIEGTKNDDNYTKNSSIHTTTLSSGTTNDDIVKIKEQLNMTTKRLDMTVKRMTEKNKANSKNNTPKHSSFNNSLFPIREDSNKKPPVIPRNDNIIINTNKPIKKLEDLFNAEQEQSIIIHNPVNNDNPQNNASFIQDILLTEQPPINQAQPESLPLYKQLINDLLQALTSSSDQSNPLISINDLYTQLISLYSQITSSELKSAYINHIQMTLNSKDMIQAIATTAYCELYDFILTILSIEILSNSNQETIIVSLQSLAEDFKGYRDMTEILQVLLFLLRKYFPQEIDHKLKEESLVMLKILTYIIKESIKTISINPNNIVKPKVIIIEINELFTSTSLGSLKTTTPNVKLYENIFTVIKALTDELYSKNKEIFPEVIAYLIQNKTTSKTYSQYLNTLADKQ